jgi:ATP/ADP translocase
MSTQAPIVPSEGTPKKISFFAIGSAITGALSYLLIFFHNLIDMGFLWAAILAPISALIAIIVKLMATCLARNLRMQG